MSKTTNSDKILTVLLVIPALFLAQRAVLGFSYTESVEVLARLSAVLIIAFCLSALYSALADKKLTSFTKYFSYTLLAISLLGLLALGIGALNDVMGMHCSGILGSTQSCLNSASLKTTILLYHPLLLSAGAILGLVGICFQGKILPSSKSKK